MKKYTLEELRVDKEDIENTFFRLCESFEQRFDLKIKGISLIEVNPRLHPGLDEKGYEEYKSGVPKLTRIELTIEI